MQAYKVCSKSAVLPQLIRSNKQNNTYKYMGASNTSTYLNNIKYQKY